MPLSAVILIFMAMLMAALLLEPLARRLRLPLSAALVVGGFAGSELMVSLGIDTGLRWHQFHELVFFVFLPALIFHSAFSTDARVLLRNLVPILLLALALPLQLEGWWTVQSIAYGVVPFSLFPQAPLLGPVLAVLQKKPGQL